VKADGDTVTPDGAPVTVTLIKAENPFTAAALMVTGWTGPPAVKSIDVTLVFSEKSGPNFAPDTVLQPLQSIAKRKTSQSWGNALSAFMPTVVHPAMPKKKASTQPLPSSCVASSPGFHRFLSKCKAPGEPGALRLSSGFAYAE
jgi:hypothetical protein